MKKSVSIVLSAILSAIAIFVTYYIALPPINLYSRSFWWFLIIASVEATTIFVLVYKLFGGKTKRTKNGSRSIAHLIPTILLVIVFIANWFTSTPLFHADAYASLFTFEEAEFTETIKETDEISNIALMDSESALLLANRTLGSLVEMVSQYNLSSWVTTFNLNDTPQKAISLDYAGFFKWVNSKEHGIPGYILVDPVHSSSEYVALDKPMIYSPSAYFGQDLVRAVRFKYPTAILQDAFFEIDDEGNPWYIIPTFKIHAGTFGAADVEDVILFNPCTGESLRMGVAETPTWIDNVYSGAHTSTKFDYYGLYSDGYWNSITTKKGCKVTTDDYGYVCMNDDIYTYTGVTSVVQDESNIGFILTNSRTGKSVFLEVPGAEEYSAMSAAEGEVQEKGYVASFPSLVNIAGNPTYIMVLKDNAGLVKMYGLVNAENYSIVAVAETQKDVKKLYLNKLNLETGETLEDEPNVIDGETKTETAQIEDIKYLPIDGNTWVYISLSSGAVVKAEFAQFESLILLSAGDTVTLSYIIPQEGNTFPTLVNVKAEH